MSLSTVRCADAASVPPADGVTVRAVGFPDGLRTVKTAPGAVDVTTANPVIADVPVARPVAVGKSSLPSSVRTSCPGWFTLTLNITR